MGCAHGMHAFYVRTHPPTSTANILGAEGAAAVCRALETNTTLQSLNLSRECAAVFLGLFCVVFVLIVFEGGLVLFWLYLQCLFDFGFARGFWGVHMVCMLFASALTLLRHQRTA